MAYTNSPLAAYTNLSPNHSGLRTHSIDRITPHCVVGQLSAESICGCFTSTSRQASCNYGIGKDGRVSLCVEEKNRSWCSSSAANDQRAITIECARDLTHPYAMNSAVYTSLIELCTDICKRNGKAKLLWLGDKNKTLNYAPAPDEMVLTVHRWFANKSCPGDWLYNRLGDLASKVTAKLGGTSTAAPAESTATETASSFPVVPFTVKVLVDDLNYRSEPSMRGAIKGQTGKGVFTITAVSDGWGKLKSGAGWIYLENPSYCTVLGSTSNSGTTENKSETVTATTGIQASEFKSLSEKEAAEKIGKLCRADRKKSGILASVSAAQFILESGYGKSELAQNANNCFGMKCSLSGNTWAGSVWDGKSKYTKQTSEEYTAGTITTITEDFRKYASVEDSVADHSAYLNGAMNGSKLRYDGLKGCADYKQAIQIIKDGGYATSSTYVEKICSIIEKYNLTQYDVTETTQPTEQKTDQTTVPYLVRVAISDLNIRKGPGTDHAKIGKYTGKGVFTIVEEADGKGASKWGLLKAYTSGRNGWISLDYAKKV